MKPDGSSDGMRDGMGGMDGMLDGNGCCTGVAVAGPVVADVAVAADVECVGVSNVNWNEVGDAAAGRWE